VNLELGKFYSRYGDARIFTQTGDNTYVVSGKSLYFRYTHDENTMRINMFDFEGGPTYTLNKPFPFNDSKSKISALRLVESCEGESSVEITVVSP